MKGPRACAVLQIGMLALALFLPLWAFGDGKVIPTRAYPVPDIPDQQAMLCWAGDSETLVIETSFAGQGTNFAWIVPLPSAPKIQPVSAGLFPTLQMVFQPRIVLSVRHYWVILPVAATVLLLFRLSEGSPGCLFFFLGCFLVLVLLLLPALGPAHSRAKADASSDVGQVQVLNRQPAGLFDTVTLQSINATALFHWLNENGFNPATNMEPVVSAYIREGWVFAAARLHSDTAPGETQATHPLAFTFKTTRPVYPLRLTGVDNKSCRIELYVFGPSRAAVPGFSAQRCGHPNYQPEPGRLRLETGDLRVRNPELAKFAVSAPVATKLTATLSAGDMVHDGYVSWRPYWPAGSTVYTRRAAVTLSANIAALVFSVLVFVWWWKSRFSPGFQPVRSGPWLAPTAIMVGVGVYMTAIPTIDGPSLRVLRSYHSSVRLNASILSTVLSEEMLDRNLPPAMIDACRQMTPGALQNVLRPALDDLQKAPYLSRYDKGVLTNYFTGQLVRFEASPGNYVVRPANASHTVRVGYVSYPATNCLELVWHDVDGVETITNLVNLRSTP